MRRLRLEVACDASVPPEPHGPAAERLVVVPVVVWLESGRPIAHENELAKTALPGAAVLCFFRFSFFRPARLDEEKTDLPRENRSNGCLFVGDLLVLVFGCVCVLGHPAS